MVLWRSGDHGSWLYPCYMVMTLSEMRWQLCLEVTACVLRVESFCLARLRRPVAEAAYGHDGRMPGTVEIFSQRRGQWKAATQSQEFFRTLQRYYSNAYMDAEKQNAINVFLGYFQPQEGKPELWELDSDQNYNAWKAKMDDYQRSLFKRSLSDGNILRERSSPMSSMNMKKDLTNSAFSNDQSQGGSKILSESSPEISTCESGVTISRYTSSAPRRQLFVDMHRERWLDNDQGDACSNFVDLDWLSSSGNSCDEELYERSMLMSSPIVGRSSENVINGIMGDRAPSTSEYGSSMKGREHTGTDLSYDDVQDFEVLEEFSDSFVRWVTFGETLGH
ncbi:hypothetical protein RHGRI_012851 [Rhododendron griersonianum]|uniref:Uncharacterized protein n=1 Tax=Rhododendron griersonianum TaxID=479676 RepID=A0AAV6K3H2_9ERIC|nr:hypothetical protein RHGRI_012851 [Rhododendron griersonianum]